MKITLVIALLLTNLKEYESFKHYKFKNLKNCPFNTNNKKECKTGLNKKNNYYNKKNIVITYPSFKSDVNDYKPRSVDWESVISGCQAACNFDKRLCNFYIRASAHDSLSISEGFGGTDGSMLITEDELKRPENNYDNFGYILSKNALFLAKKFDASVADIISVCGAYSVKHLGGIDIISSSTNEDPFLVGRLDSTIPNPANQLVPENADTEMFNSFAIKYNFTLEEFSALLGSHAIIDEKECLNNDNSYCDPLSSDCSNIAMFTWVNSYYNDICTQNISMSFNSIPIEFIKSKKSTIKNELCKFTSNYFRDKSKIELEEELNVNVNEILKEDVAAEANNMLVEEDTQITRPINVVTYDKETAKKWRYTTNDAWLGLACQDKLNMDKNTISGKINTQIKNSMIKFKNSNIVWETMYMNAYKKMINNNVRWFKSKSNGFKINGSECNSGYKWLDGVRYCKTAFLPNDKFYN